MNDRVSAIFSLSMQIRALLTLAWVAASAPVMAEFTTADFNDPTQWTKRVVGRPGPSVNTTSDGLGFAAAFPIDAEGDPASEYGITFSGGYGSTFLLTGDFTVEVDFNLSAWPKDNGVRIGLGIEAWYATQRVSVYSVGGTGDLYFFQAGNSGSGSSATSDTVGKLRMVRSGNSFSGYFWKDGAWTLLGTGTADGAAYPIYATAWSDYRFFNDVPVVAEFSNLRYTGQVVETPVTPTPVPEPSTLIAGALLLLPFGLQGIRCLRNRKAA